ncbi:hypothetical protein JCM6882_004230 [Rhodosporidiobolus microsporus]
MDDDLNVPSMSARQHDATLMMGPSQAGYQVQLIVFTAFCCLFYGYWSSGELRSHNRAGRVALWISLVLNTAYTALCFYQAYIGSVSQDRTYDNLSNGGLAWNVLPILGGLISVLTEGFLSVRAGALLPTRPFRIFFWVWVGALMALSLVGCSVVCYGGVEYYYGREPAIEWNTGMAIWLWSSAACDVLISGACAWGLRSRIAGFNEVTDGLLRKLMMIAIRTASYTSLLSVVGAVTMSIWPDDDLNSFICLAFWLPIAGFYGLSLFTFSAGSRRAIDARFNSSSNAYLPQHRSPPKNNTRLAGVYNSGSRPRDSGVPHTPLQIAVQHSSEVAYDEPNMLDVELEEKKQKEPRRVGDLAV